MTREIKVGLVVSCSFLALVCTVVATKMGERKRAALDDQLAPEMAIPAKPTEPEAKAPPEGGTGSPASKSTPAGKPGPEIQFDPSQVVAAQPKPSPAPTPVSPKPVTPAPLAPTSSVDLQPLTVQDSKTDKESKPAISPAAMAPAAAPVQPAASPPLGLSGPDKNPSQPFGPAVSPTPAQVTPEPRPVADTVKPLAAREEKPAPPLAPINKDDKSGPPMLAQPPINPAPMILPVAGPADTASQGPDKTATPTPLPTPAPALAPVASTPLPTVGGDKTKDDTKPTPVPAQPDKEFTPLPAPAAQPLPTPMPSPTKPDDKTAGPAAPEIKPLAPPPALETKPGPVGLDPLPPEVAKPVEPQPADRGNNVTPIPAAPLTSPDKPGVAAIPTKPDATTPTPNPEASEFIPLDKLKPIHATPVPADRTAPLAPQPPPVVAPSATGSQPQPIKAQPAPSPSNQFRAVPPPGMIDTGAGVQTGAPQPLGVNRQTDAATPHATPGSAPRPAPPTGPSAPGSGPVAPTPTAPVPAVVPVPPTTLTPPKPLIGPTGQRNSYQEKQLTIQPGDTYRILSQRHFGSDTYAEALQLWNKNHDEAQTDAQRQGRLVVGEKVFVPSSDILERTFPQVVQPVRISASPQPVAEARTTTPPPAPVQYRVGGQGEPLYAIAQKTLNNLNRWGEIKELNPTLDVQRPVPAGALVLLPAGASVPPENTP